METNFHNSLAYYFQTRPLYLDGEELKKPNVRKLVEQPWQELEVAKVFEKQFEIDPEIEAQREKLWDNVTNTLCNLDFIQAKAAAKLTYDLVDDFNEVLKVIPDNAENIRKEKGRQIKLDKYIQDLIACAKGVITIEELDIPDSITPWTEEQMEAEIERIKTNPNRSDKLKEFLNFLDQEAVNLKKFSNEFHFFALQQAWNYTDEGPVGKAAEISVAKIPELLLIRNRFSRKQWNPLPQRIKTLMGHTDWLMDVSNTPDWKRAISASWDKTCILWNLETAESLETLKGENTIVEAASITPDGKKALIGYGNGTCILWNLETVRPMHVLKGHNDNVISVSITPDGICGISGSYDKTVIVWDLITGKALLSLEAHTESLKAVSISPDGKRGISCSSDKTCIIWDLATGEKIKTLNWHTWGFNDISLTPDERYAISASQDNSCILWDMKMGMAINTLNGHSQPVDAVSITPDGKWAISGSRDKTCIIWDLINGKAIQTLYGHIDEVTSVYICPIGDRAISSSKDHTCLVWDLSKGYSHPNQILHSGPVSKISINLHTTSAISSSRDDGTCIIWDLNTGKAKKFLKGHTSWVEAIQVTHDGKIAFSGSRDKTCILWDLVTGMAIYILKGHTSHINAVSITPDGNLALSGSFDRTCILWELSSGKELYKLTGQAGLFNDAIFVTPDGKKGISCSDNGFCSIWDLTNGQLLQSLQWDSRILSFSLTPDGKSAISGSANGNCIIWNLITGENISHFTGHNHLISVISVTPDGRKAISGSMDKTCIVWDLKTGKAIHYLKGHNEDITSIAITADNKMAVTSSYDNLSILWDIEDGLKLACLVNDSYINASAFFPGGLMLGSKSGEVITLQFDKNLICSNKANTTIRQIWDYKNIKYTCPLADCPLCGHRFKPPQDIIEIVFHIIQTAGLKPEQSPCLELPDEAWENPGLLGECPLCHEPLKFNPFFGSDQKGIEDYLSNKERENIYLKKFDEAEETYNNSNWEEAYNLYLKLVQQGLFDINYMRYKMSLCKINCFSFNTPEIVNDINILMKLLKDKGAEDKVQLITEKLKERQEEIKQEEILKRKAEKSWWKKLF